MSELNKTFRDRSASESDTASTPKTKAKKSTKTLPARRTNYSTRSSTAKQQDILLPTTSNAGNQDLINLNNSPNNSGEEFHGFQSNSPVADQGQWAGLLEWNEEARMANADETLQALARLAESTQQLAEARIASSTNAVLTSCKNKIIPFKLGNVQNFLSSVKSTCEEFAESPENIVRVLDYAKLRVDHDTTISSTTFATFQEFSVLFTKRFMPITCHMSLMTQLLTSCQGKNESTKAYTDKMELVKENYIKALDSSYRSENQELSELRRGEAEKTATEAFMRGLRDDIRKYILEKPTSFTAAVALALHGEQSNEMKRKSELSSSVADSADKKPTTYQNFRGNSRQGYQQRGGFNRGANRGFARGYQGGNSNYNRSYYQGQNNTSATGNQQRDEKSVIGGGPVQAGSNNINAGPSNFRPRGNGQASRGACYVCGDYGHRAAECSQRVARVAAVEQSYGEQQYYDDRGYDNSYEHEPENWRVNDNEAKNDPQPLSDSTCSAATIRILGRGHFSQ